MELPEGSQCLHYGQQLFEGMKVQTGADGKVYAFRPRDNARRLNDGARYLRGAEVPEELFVRGIEEVVAANLPYIPPLRQRRRALPAARSTSGSVTTSASSRPSATSSASSSPRSARTSGAGSAPTRARRSWSPAYDRAAPHGTGHVKAGGNYACSFQPGAEAKAAGFAEALYLDPAEHRYIDEIGAANFLAFSGDTLITPDSTSVLPSITRLSLLQIAAELFEWPTEQRKIPLEELDEIDAGGVLRHRCGHHLDPRDRRRRPSLGLPLRRALAAAVRQAGGHPDRHRGRSLRLAARIPI